MSDMLMIVGSNSVVTAHKEHVALLIISPYSVHREERHSCLQVFLGIAHSEEETKLIIPLYKA
jgi:hypothetical protein